MPPFLGRGGRAHGHNINNRGLVVLVIRGYRTHPHIPDELVDLGVGGHGQTFPRLHAREDEFLSEFGGKEVVSVYTPNKENKQTGDINENGIMMIYREHQESHLNWSHVVA